MTKARKPLAAAVVALVALSIVLVHPARADSTSDEGSFLAKLNELRGSKGVGALAHNHALAEVARSWSVTMATVGSISHNPSLAAQAPSNWSRVGENVGMGTEVQGLHDAFVKSPTHYRNMVDGGFDAVGVGVVRNPDGTIFVTVNFMTSMTPVVAAPAPPPAVVPPTPAPAPAPTPVTAPAPPPAEAPAEAAAPAQTPTVEPAVVTTPAGPAPAALATKGPSADSPTLSLVLVGIGLLVTAAASVLAMARRAPRRRA